MTEEKAREERLKLKARMKQLRSKTPKKQVEAQADWYEKVVIRARIRMKEKRDKQTEDEKHTENFHLQERMIKLRSSKSPEETAKDNEKARIGMAETRQKKIEEDIECDNIVQKHKQREARAKLTGKEHLLQNLQAKKGMKLLNEFGRLNDFQRRGRYKTTEKTDYKSFMQKSKTCSEILRAVKPDIVEKLNQEIRNEKEIERKRKEDDLKKDKAGRWSYSGESGEWYWTGEQEPNYGDTFCYSPPTEEERKIMREAEEREFEWFMEERKRKQTEKRKQKENERKEAMSKPIDPLPEYEMCQYEKLRECRIKEREKAMIESGFFDELMQMKKDFGFVNRVSETKLKKKEKLNGGKGGNCKQNSKGIKKEKNADQKKVDKSDKDIITEKGKTNSDTKEEVVKAEGEKPEDKEPWYKNFQIDEWDLHDCLE